MFRPTRRSTQTVAKTVRNRKAALLAREGTSHMGTLETLENRWLLSSGFPVARPDIGREVSLVGSRGGLVGVTYYDATYGLSDYGSLPCTLDATPTANQVVWAKYIHGTHTADDSTLAFQQTSGAFWADKSWKEAK